MTPFIEDRNGNTYEFKVTFADKKKYEKGYQKEIQKIMFSSLSSKEIENLQNREKLSDVEIQEITSKALGNLDEEEIKATHNRKTIKSLLQRDYQLSSEQVDDLFAELDEDYGAEQVDERFDKILNVVFTQLGVAEVKTMPAWGLE